MIQPLEGPWNLKKSIGDKESDSLKLLKLTAKPPEKWWLGNAFPFEKVYFRLRLVSFREGMFPAGIHHLFTPFFFGGCRSICFLRHHHTSKVFVQWNTECINSTCIFFQQKVKLYWDPAILYKLWIPKHKKHVEPLEVFLPLSWKWKIS